MIQLYSPNIKEDRLISQLKVLHSGKESPEKDFKSIVTYLKRLNHIEKEYFSEVIKLVKLILITPATNAVCERSFSALRRVKIWLRATTRQARLNWCLTLHAHKEKTDALFMTSIANESVSRNPPRTNIF